MCGGCGSDCCAGARRVGVVGVCVALVVVVGVCVALRWRRDSGGISVVRGLGSW